MVGRKITLTAGATLALEMVRKVLAQNSDLGLGGPWKHSTIQFIADPDGDIRFYDIDFAIRPDIKGWALVQISNETLAGQTLGFITFCAGDNYLKEDSNSVGGRFLCTFDPATNEFDVWEENLPKRTDSS